ncbi:GNAT family N-acetyltransferase [Mesorhizobium sp. CAU 1732]|uniref:GNAT family N-acetyltransferase n=1 Tax=Mesorhizobium sp. CAU 1732 TaxID=3140358 RepID=UPI0032603C95
MIDIRKGDFDAFFEAPFVAYGPDTLYVSPMRNDLQRFLSADANPLFSSRDEISVFTAHRDGRPVGRITAHVHAASNKLHGTSRACFGYFDCADDQEAANALLSSAEDWARSRGFSEIAGNFNLTAMQQAGVLTDGYEHPPYTDQIYSPPHLKRLLETAGYTAEFPMTTIEIDLTTTDPEMLLGPRQRALLASGDYAFAPVNRRSLERRMEDARTILNASFIDNPMFVPVTKEEFDFQANEMKTIIDPRISVVLERKGEAIGAIIAIPDLNPLVRATGARLRLSTPWHYLKYRLTRRRAVIIFQGVLPEHQGEGVNPLMLWHVASAMKKAGYRTVGGTWIADVNKASLRQAEKAGARPLHRLHLYRKDLRHAG